MVRIRLRRVGTKGKPYYRIIACASTAARNGKFVEQLGTYDPLKSPSEVKIDRPRALEYLKNGARASVTVERLLKREGAWSDWEAIKPAKKPRRKPVKARVKPPKPPPKPRKPEPMPEEPQGEKTETQEQ